MVLVIAVSLIAATIATSFLGAYWYSFSGFGRTWLKFTFPGKHFSEIDTSGMNVAMGISFASQFATACTLHALYSFLLPEITIQGVLSFGGAIALVSILLLPAHYAFSQRPWELFFIDNVGYGGCVVLLQSFIIALVHKCIPG